MAKPKKEQKIEPLPFAEALPELRETIKLRPQFIDEYLEADQKEKEYKNLKESLRPDVLSFLKEQSLDDIYWKQTGGKPKYNLEKMYEFFKGRLKPKRLDQCTIKTFDQTKLDELFLEGYYTKEELNGLYDIPDKVDAIEIKANRQKKKPI